VVKRRVGRRPPLPAMVALGCSLALGCSDDPSLPSGFGVNVVVKAQALDTPTRARIVAARLTATGPGPAPVVKTFEVAAAAISSGELRFRYIPSSDMGMLALAFDALDGAGTVVASGVGAAVTLAAGKAVTATIQLGAPSQTDGGLPDAPDAPVDGPTPDGSEKKANGEPCTAATASSCQSGICADNVCCNAACTGTCESCVAGQRGRCDPVADNMDPDTECGPAAVPDGGAATDASGGIQAPDGGVMGSAQACAGSCNGQRACKYPGVEKSCGNRWCNSETQVAAMSCDGQGTCSPNLTACVDYACADGACRSVCASHEECQPKKTYCNAANRCAPKKGNGLVCNTRDECQSGFCAGGVCCNSACDSPFTCNETPGQCKCPGVTCAAGVACQVYYRDADGDGFGDKFGTIANAGARAACAGAPPAGFVADNQDCDDGDGNAKPGQTGFFDVPSKTKGTYDYDCNGVMAKEIPENLGSACKFCSGLFTCNAPTATCTAVNQRAGLACNVQCSASGGRLLLCLCGPTDGFIAPVNCGVLGDFKICGTCSAIGGVPTGPYTYKRKQTCH
jgi:hypothetical protein